ARTSHTISTTVLVTSLLLGTSPFLRASWSLLGVGFSVLSPPSFLSAIAESFRWPLGCGSSQLGSPLFQGRSTCPPNWNRIADSTFSANVWSWRDRKRT